MRTLYLVSALVALLGCGTPVNSGLGGADAAADGGDTRGATGCSASCAAQARAGCSGFSMGACVSRCEMGFAALTACGAQLDAVSRCTLTATYTCTPDGMTTSTSCVDESVALTACAQGRPDGGPASGPDGG